MKMIVLMPKCNLIESAAEREKAGQKAHFIWGLASTYPELAEQGLKATRQTHAFVDTAREVGGEPS